MGMWGLYGVSEGKVSRGGGVRKCVGVGEVRRGGR